MPTQNFMDIIESKKAQKNGYRMGFMVKASKHPCDRKCSESNKEWTCRYVFIVELASTLGKVILNLFLYLILQLQIYFSLLNLY